MTAYDQSPSAPFPPLLQPNVPSFAWGSQASGPPCHMKITNVARTTNVVTLNVVIVEGNIPAVGDLVTVAGTSAGSSGANTATPISLSAVNIVAATGVGTVQYTLNGSNIASVADAGDAYSVAAVTTETPTPGNGGASASQQFALMPQIGKNGTPFSVDGKFAGAPGATEIDVQVASIDQDAYYQTISGGNITVIDSTNNTFHLDGTLTNARFVRLLMRSRANSVAVYATISAG